MRLGGLSSGDGCDRRLTPVEEQDGMLAFSSDRRAEHVVERRRDNALFHDADAASYSTGVGRHGGRRRGQRRGMKGVEGGERRNPLAGLWVKRERERAEDAMGVPLRFACASAASSASGCHKTTTTWTPTDSPTAQMWHFSQSQASD